MKWLTSYTTLNRTPIRLIPFWVVTLTFSARACPLCQTPTGKHVRAAIFGPHFWFYMGVTVLPFAIFLVITALFYCGAPAKEPRFHSSACLSVDTE